MGCSTHSVPSWSKVATRSSWGTNVGLDLSVVFCTNSTIACLAGPSFHEGSGSPCVALCALATVIRGQKMAAKAITCLRKVRREDLISFFLFGEFDCYHF